MKGGGLIDGLGTLTKTVTITINNSDDEYYKYNKINANIKLLVNQNFEN